ncbi:hypothetical protein [Lutibacter flavus]|uniref:Uncharacterized protein n=1 Tax=Lutibacter flavus TaxID=691689 RepID=A0A238XJ79_9FLAO|nr:hypothetical protein [Lutibacter flavus]SNR58752.1 hypothetical protein SAMN04488111_1858 [Lutibacter flavus]
MEENKIDIINSKIATKQLELNDEQEQDKKNKILHQIKILNVRKEMEEAREKLTERNHSLTNLKKYTGAIRLKSGGQPVKVYCDATSASQARKIIQAQFDVKSWFKQMTPNFNI